MGELGLDSSDSGLGGKLQITENIILKLRFRIVKCICD